MGGIFGAIMSSVVGQLASSAMGSIMGGQQAGPPAAGTGMMGPSSPGTSAAQSSGPKSITPGGMSNQEYQLQQQRLRGDQEAPVVGGASGFAPAAGANQIIGSTRDEENKVF